MQEKKNWWIYQATNQTDTSRLDKRKEKKPKWRDKSKPKHNALSYQLINDELLDAINAAIYLRRPLLVTGDAGIGKSSLAKSIAEELTDTELLSWHITSKSTLQEALYSYDALARLQDIQMKKLYGDLKEIEKSESISTDIGNYIKLGALGEAFVSEGTKVVLIDEIDKSDIDLPNDLLHVFEEQEFTIDEVKRSKEESITIGKYTDIPSNGRIVCRGDFPIVIMTSNGEREFSSAFLRRCISIDISLSEIKKTKIEQLTNIVIAHFVDSTLSKKEKEKEKEEIKTKLGNIVEEFVKLQSDGRILSNDQLLNIAHMILNTNEPYESFRESVLKSLESE